MTLATVDEQGIPDARIVLLKGFDEQGFCFSPITIAGRERSWKRIRMPALFFWKELERQVRVTSVAEKISMEESIAYFNSRPDGSKIGAWASPNIVVAGKAWLKKPLIIIPNASGTGRYPNPALGWLPGKTIEDRILAGKTQPPARPHPVYRTGDTWRIERN